MKQEQWNEALNHIDISLIEEYVKQSERLSFEKQTLAISPNPQKSHCAKFKTKRLFSLIAAILTFGIVLSLSMMWIADRNDLFEKSTTDPSTALSPSTQNPPSTTTPVIPVIPVTPVLDYSCKDDLLSNVLFALTAGENALIDLTEEVWLATKGHELKWSRPADEKDGVRYYGTYNNGTVLFAAGNLFAETEIKIGDHSFWHSASFALYYCADGQLISLDQAYSDGSITKTDVAQIQQRHLAYQAFFQNRKEYSINVEMGDTTLDGDIVSAIKQAYASKVLKDNDYDLSSLAVNCVYTPPSEVFYAVYIGDEEENSGKEISYYAYRSTVFAYYTQMPLLIYCDGSLYTLEEFEQSGIVDDLSLSTYYSDLFMTYMKTEKSQAKPSYDSIVLPDFSHVSLNSEQKELVKYAAYCWEEQCGEALVWLDEIHLTGATCYGIYGETVIFFVATEEEGRTEVKVGDYSYWYDYCFDLRAFYDGKFYSIDAAYMQGLLNDENLHSIYHVHGKNVSNIHLFRIEQLPKLGYIMPETEKDLLIRKEISETITNLTPENVKYRCVAIFGDDTYALYSDNGMVGFMVTYEEVGGYWFVYGDSNKVQILSNGELYTMPEAYENGLITLQQVAHLRDVYSSVRYTVSQPTEKPDIPDVPPPTIEKVYCDATLEDQFEDNKILIIVFPQYNSTPYTAEDFAEIGCVNVKQLFNHQKDDEPSRCLALTLDKNSKENVLAAIKKLEEREDIYSAEPNYIWTID